MYRTMSPKPSDYNVVRAFLLDGGLAEHVKSLEEIEGEVQHERTLEEKNELRRTDSGGDEVVMGVLQQREVVDIDPRSGKFQNTVGIPPYRLKPLVEYSLFRTLLGMLERSRSMPRNFRPLYFDDWELTHLRFEVHDGTLSTARLPIVYNQTFPELLAWHAEASEFDLCLRRFEHLARGSFSGPVDALFYLRVAIIHHAKLLLPQGGDVVVDMLKQRVLDDREWEQTKQRAVEYVTPLDEDGQRGLPADMRTLLDELHYVGFRPQPHLIGKKYAFAAEARGHSPYELCLLHFFP